MDRKHREDAEFWGLAKQFGLSPFFVEGNPLSDGNVEQLMAEVGRQFRSQGYVTCAHCHERVIDLADVKVCLVPVTDQSVYVTTVHKEHWEAFRSSFGGRKNEYIDPGIVARNIKWGEDCKLALGHLENAFVRCPLLMIQYADGATLERRLRVLKDCLVSSRLTAETAVGDALKWLCTMRTPAGMLAVDVAQNAGVILEQTDQGIVTRFEITSLAGTGDRTAFAASAVLPHDQGLSNFLKALCELGIVLVLFCAEHCEDQLYVATDNCVLVNLPS